MHLRQHKHQLREQPVVQKQNVKMLWQRMAVPCALNMLQQRPYVQMR